MSYTARAIPALVLSALGLSACGSAASGPPPPVKPAWSAAQAASLPAPPSTPYRITVNGTLRATGTGRPLGGTRVVTESASAVTDRTGRWALPAAAGRMRVTVFAAVPRVTWLESPAADLDAIGGGDFDLAFYRELARNGHERPGHLEPLRRWTATHLIYLRTVDEAGAPIDPDLLDMVESTVQESIAAWTEGRMVVTVVRGAETREGTAGWTTIKWPSAVNPDICGSAQIGQDDGVIELQHRNTACGRGGRAVAARTVRHEIGHALGFWHTSDPRDVMYGGEWSDGEQGPSAREIRHAAVVYSRPVGNIDPDTDPVVRATPPRMSAHCGIRRR